MKQLKNQLSNQIQTLQVYFESLLVFKSYALLNLQNYTQVIEIVESNLKSVQDSYNAFVLDSYLQDSQYHLSEQWKLQAPNPSQSLEVTWDDKEI